MSEQNGDPQNRETKDKLEEYSNPAENFFHEDVDEDTSCGLKLPFRRNRYLIPQLQRFASPKWALGLLSIAYFFTDGIMNGVFTATISTVEKQFQLRTTETGIIGGMIDVGACIALSASVYFGDKICKTQWIGTGMLWSAIGSLIFVTPQFISPPYNYGQEGWNYCGNVSSTNCEGSPLRTYRYALMTGSFFIGSGAEYVTAISTTFLDENVKQSYSSMYHGILNCFGALGPAFGYLVSGVTLRIFNDPTKSVSIQPESSLWVGAWWICYVAASIGIMIIVLPVFLLPRNLPGSERVRSNREQKISKAEESNTDHIGHRLLLLLKNKLYVMICLSEMVHSILIYGFITYAVKIGVDLYGMTESFASFVLGSISIISSALGYFVGGFVVSKFTLKLQGILQLMLACSLVSFAFSFGFLVECPGKNIAIVNETGTYNPNGLCNIDCGCTTDRYNPVCDDEGSIYFSPCFAGCKTQDNTTTGFDCECVTSKNAGSSVSAHKCAFSICENFSLALFILFVCFLAAFLTVTPSTQATLRSVRFDERTTAISVQRMSQIIFGRMVGRLLFGTVLEDACLMSSTDCQERGACRIYDTNLMTKNLTILMASGKLLIVLINGFAILHVRRRNARRKRVGETTLNQK